MENVILICSGQKKVVAVVFLFLENLYLHTLRWILKNLQSLLQKLELCLNLQMNLGELLRLRLENHNGDFAGELGSLEIALSFDHELKLLVLALSSFVSDFS